MPKKAKAALTIHERLREAIGRVDRPDTFCTNGDLPLVMPGLEVDGVGAVGLPLGKTQARKLIKLCRQAPYGKGTETVVDTDVRRVWELDPEQFQLTNPKWNVVLPTIMGDVQEELGVEIDGEGGVTHAEHDELVDDTDESDDDSEEEN